ncbi:MAG: DUF1109 family protein [Acidobacteria bacterium]|nr:DUF1109 family protein [Acidobacteriota bacterium]
MSGPPAPPRVLREAAARAAARPVRPLLAPAARAALVLAVALASAAALVAILGPRDNAGWLGPLLLAAPSLLLLAAAAALVGLALREAIPGRAAPGAARIAALAGVPLLVAALAEWVAAATRAGLGGPAPLACYPVALAGAAPASALLLVLLARAYPTRPAATAAIGGLGTGLVAAAALHLACPQPAFAHVFFVHGGAVFTLALAAAAVAAALTRADRRLP